MKSLFLGLTIANLLLLSIVFTLGLLAIDAQGEATNYYLPHILLAITAGLVTLLAHIGTFTYFIATTKWLTAAAEKGNLDEREIVAPSKKRKSKVHGTAMMAVLPTMLAMFAGAGVDEIAGRLWPVEVHFTLAIIAILANIFSAFREYKFIDQQKQLMDKTLGILNNTPGIVVESD